MYPAEIVNPMKAELVEAGFSELLDSAAVDAALAVELVEIGRLGLADGGVGRRRARIGHDVADLDLGVAELDLRVEVHQPEVDVGALRFSFNRASLP